MWTQFTLLILSVLYADILYAQRLEECVDGVVEVVENSPRLTHTCITTDSVTWRFLLPGGTSDIPIGTCNSGASSCSVTGPPGFSLTRLNNSATRLHSNLTTRQDGGRYTYRCEISTSVKSDCQADVVVPAVLSAVNVTLTPAGSSWTVQGSVDVTTVYSSLGRYSCQWFHKYGPGQESSVWKGSPSLSPNPSDTSNTQNRAGSCSFSTASPGNTGTYTYRVLLSPGDSSSQAEQSVEIARPDTVSVTCSPSPYVPENTDVTCTCNTQSVGKPAGRLVWFRGSDNNITINTGNYGNTSLTTTPQTMRRTQGDVQFRCDVDWATRVTGQPYTAMISYGPDRVMIPENRTFYTDSAGSRDLTVICHATDVRPATGLIYTWTGRCAGVTTSMCTFRPRPPGSSGGSDVKAQVVCTVRNPHNNNFTKQGSFQLDLKYPPSSSPTIGGYSQGQALYKGDNLTLTCMVTGGDPLITSVNLTCPGHHGNGATSGQSSSLTIPSLSAADHGIACGCSGQWIRPDYYTLTDTRTLTVYYAPEQTKLTVNNNVVNLTVSEGITVVLACRADGRPTPNMRLVKNETGREVHSVAGGDLVVDDRDSWLNYTLTNVSCSDTSTYICTAGNDAGTGPTDSGALFVSCPPRFAGLPAVDIPSVNYMNQSVQLTFNLWAVPAPVSHHIVFLGSTLNTTQPAANVTGIVFNVTVRRTVELYNYTYGVTVLKVTDTSAAGYYQLTVNNELGEAQMVFQVKYNEEEIAPPANSSSFPVGAAVGIAIAGIVAACVTAAIFVFYRKRRALQKAGGSSQTKARSHHGTEGKDSDMMINTLYGSHGDSEGEDSMIVNTMDESLGKPDFRARKGEYEEISVNHDKSAAMSSSVEPSTRVKPTTVTQPNLAAPGEPGDENYASRPVTTSAPKPQVNAKPATSSVPSVKPTATKKETPAKMKKDKRNPKKGDKKSLGKGHDSQQVYGNMSLTMTPMEVYENAGFHGDDARSVANGGEEGTGPNVNKDGLVYTTIRFTESQRTKAQQQPSSRQATEYVSIDFTKQGPIMQD